jgi:hypothetical protein
MMLMNRIGRDDKGQDERDKKRLSVKESIRAAQ